MKALGMIKVLIVDDSPVFCEMVSRGITQDGRIEVIGTAGHPFEARDKILECNPDVLLLDIQLPRMDGLTFLGKLMPQYPIPVVVVSAHEEAILEALEAGAVDFVKKPSGGSPECLHTFIQELIVKIKVASMANVSVYKSAKMPAGPQSGRSGRVKVIAIGASTGGTEAIHTVLKGLPRNMPGIVIVQHMPENFTKMYADRLNAECALEVKEGADGDFCLPGRVLIAPGGHHMKLVRNEDSYRVICYKDEKVNGHRPSVDVLFHSVANMAGKNAVGVLLTGMGYDGAKGLLEMRRKGAYTIGQDEESSIVYGMPKVAYDIGGVTRQLPLNRIASELISLL